MKPTRLFILTLCAMIAFAANSLLCRLALKNTRIDAASFTFIRIFSGAAALLVITMIKKVLIVERTASALAERSSHWSLVTGHSSLATNHSSLRQAGDWSSALALFVYAAAFSFAYNSLTAGTGALLLFGAVQATMILWGLRKGEHLSPRQLIGLVLALSGLVALLFPGLSAPPLSGSVLMLGAGLAWGIYSLRGKTAGDPTSATAGNFLRAIPLAAMVSLTLFRSTHLDPAGIGYAVLSGTIASGLGYVIWYTALPGLRAASAATIQLSVPVLAATGGILLLGEPLTIRFLCTSIAVLGGIALVVMNPSRRS